MDSAADARQPPLTWEPGSMDARRNVNQLRELARRDAIELVDRLLGQAMIERRYGRLELVYQDGVPTYVREERMHKFGRPADAASDAA